MPMNECRPVASRRRLLLGSVLLPLVSSPLQAQAEASPVETAPAAPIRPPEPRLTARHAFVGDLDNTLFALEPDTPVQIASITKLITAWVILTAELPMNEILRVEDIDARNSEFTKSNLAVGSRWRREELMSWLLVTSDNRAAAVLARTFPGGWQEFQYAMRALMTQMQLFSFDFGDPSGLSNTNKASARDLGVLLVTLSQLPWFRELARKTSIGGRPNVNRFAHDQSVSLLAGKTGFTSAAGYCLAEAEQFGSRVYAMVVLKSVGREARAEDMNRLRRFTRQYVAAA
jgi:serine-type D-Ala-D-Ala endopeptidase (penicillin-binding protein 7)